MSYNETPTKGIIMLKNLKRSPNAKLAVIVVTTVVTHIAITVVVKQLSKAVN